MSEIPPPSVPPATPPPGGGTYTPPRPPPPGGGASGSSDRTLMLVLSYLGILALVPLLTKKDDQEVQWHAKNGLALAIAWFIVWVFVFIVERFLPGIISCGIAVVHCVIAIGFIVLIIMAIMKALKGERMRFPIITDLAEKM
jgi:uncharacterized membrane protein